MKEIGSSPAVYLCLVFLRRADGALRQRDFNGPRLVRPLRVVRAGCHRNSLSEYGPSGPSRCCNLIVFTWPFLIREVG
jgi:hypothetical protein